MGCASSRNDHASRANPATGYESPISTTSMPDKIHICRLKSAASFSQRESKASNDFNVARSKIHSRTRIDSLNASSSTEASLPRIKMKYQRERRYLEV